MPIDYIPLDPEEFSIYCRKNNVLPTERELINMISLKYCTHIIPYGKNKGNFCMKKSIKEKNIYLGYCSNHIPNTMALYKCNSSTKRGLCKQRVRNSGDKCYYHKPKVNCRDVIKYDYNNCINFYFILPDFIYIKFRKTILDLYQNIFFLQIDSNYKSIYIYLDTVNLIYYLFDISIILKRLKKNISKITFIDKKTICDKYYIKEDNINEKDVLWSLDKLVDTFKVENIKFIEKCADEKVQFNNKSNGIDLSKKYNFNKYICENIGIINNKIMNPIIKDILKNKEFIPIKLFWECIKNFNVKLREFIIEVKYDFPDLYKKIEGYFNSINIIFYDDTMRYMKKAEMYSIII
jgi:hypothetical protein